jgi:hypothetical protein
LARRTRRDLSNKKIRQIVKKKFKDDHRPGDYKSGNYNLFSVYLKAFFYFLLTAIAVFIVYQLAVSLNFTSFFTQSVITPIQKSTDSILVSLEDKTLPASLEEKSEEKTEITPVATKIQIEVLNGCGVAKVARQTTTFLRNKEYDVVSFGNYNSSTIQKSMVIDRIGDRKTAEKIAEVLGIESNQVSTEIDKSKLLVASIIIGKDYKSLKPFED